MRKRHTEITRSPERAASFVLAGEPVAFPTETVYGLGASIRDAAAIRRIFDAKGRPESNPLIAHVSSQAQIEDLAETIPPSARALIRAFFPGPLTLVLRRKSWVPDEATAGLPTVGIRMPDHPVAQAFIRAVGAPVAAPSANRSGRPSPTTWEAVRDDLGGRIACILVSDRTRMGLESTVVDCTVEPPLLLRPGSISLEKIVSVVRGVRPASSRAEELARSPGTRFRHYAPRARVMLVDRGRRAERPRGGRAAFIGITPPPEAADFDLVCVCQDVEAYAYELYDFFRTCDREDVQTIVAEKVEPRGLGRALLDRLQKAAEGSYSRDT